MFFRHIILSVLTIFFFSCKSNVKENEKPKEPVYEYGYNLADFVVFKDTIKSGDTFGTIMDKHHLTVNEVYNIIEQTKDTFDYRLLKVGKPYTVFCSKDSLQKAFENYQNFSYTYRKSYLYWLNQAKREETRQKRINEIIDLCSKNIKSRGDF